MAGALFVLTSPIPGRASAEPLATAATEASFASEAEKGAEGNLKYSFTTGFPLVAGAVASVVVPSQIYKTPPPCRWCNGASPNALDRWARKAKWEDSCRAASLSYKTLVAAGGIALLPMAHESGGKEWLINSGAIVDSVAVTVALTQVVKYAVRRERPSPGICHPDRTSEPDRNMSFFSGHTAVAFAAISSAREVSRLRGRPRNGWLALGAATAAVTGYLRVAGDRHHLVDVLTGAGVGYLVGRWVPRRFHRASGTALPQARVARQSPPAFGYVRTVTAGDRTLLLGVSKGPGKSLQLRLTF